MSHKDKDREPEVKPETKPLEPIRLGIIGAGLAVKQLHWPALQDLKGHFKIVAVCDTVPAARQEIAAMASELNRQQYGDSAEVATHASYTELLARPEVEAVLLSLPIHLNAQIMFDSALAGKHILCEKPLASNLAQARKLVNNLNPVLQSRQLVLEIAENYHYRQEVDEARRWAFDEKLIGEVVLIEARSVFRMNISNGFAGTPWRVDNQYKGGIVSDGGVHYCALLRHLGGEVEQVQAFTKQMHPGATSSYDTMLLNIRFRNGLLGTLTYSGAVAAPNAETAECYIYGTQGTIRINRQQARLFAADKKGEVKEQRTFEASKSGYYLEFLNFYEAVRLNQPVIASLQECLRDFELVMAGFDSAEERSIILFEH